MSRLPEVLAEALAARSAGSGVALLSARTELVVGRVVGGELELPPGTAVPSGIYEARVALHGDGSDGELRFHSPGRIAFVPAPGGRRSHRVLLGSVAGTEAAGWVRLREARMRDVLVPFDGDVERGSRLAFVVEQVLHEDEDGNVHVVDEVLRGLVPVTPDTSEVGS
jgi:hypothetical protein